jgi:hypothetical protein
MALNKDILGQALYDFRVGFNSKTIEQLETEFGSLEAARLAMAKGEAEIFINHIKDNAEGEYQNGSLVAGPNPVTRVGGITIAVKIK